MLSRRLLKSLQTTTRTATALSNIRTYNNSRNTDRNSNSSFHQNQRNNNKQHRDQEEDHFLRNLNFRDGTEPQNHTKQRYQRRENGVSDISSRRRTAAELNAEEVDDFEQLFQDDNGNGKIPRRRRQEQSIDSEFNDSRRIENSNRSSGIGFSNIPSRRKTVTDFNEQEIDDFEQLFPDENENGRMSRSQFKENRRSKYFGGEDSERQPGKLRGSPLDESKVGDVDRIADTLLHGSSVVDKKQEREAEEDKQVLVEEKLVPEDADEIFKKMKETGLIPNAVAMLDGLCKDGLVQEAMKLFGLMREKGTIPEVVIYTAVVEGFCKAAKYDDAKRIFKKMLSNGIVANAFSYTVLIKGLCKGGKLEDAVEYCVEMLESGHLPNASTLVGLVDGFCKEKGKEQAVEVVKRLHEKGFVLDDKAVREHLEKKGPFSPEVWEVILGKKKPQKPF